MTLNVSLHASGGGAGKNLLGNLGKAVLRLKL